MKQKRQGTLLGVLTLFLLLTASASATNVKVDCTGTDPKAFHTINDALNTLDLIGPHLITVKGTCHENVSIGQRQGITIQAVPGRFATITNAANPAFITLIVYGSHNIVFDHVIIEGARGGISMGGLSLTIGWNTTIRNNIGPGLRLFSKSDVTMFDITVSGNTEEGVRETNLSAGGYYNPVTFYGNGGKSLYCDKFSVAYGDAGTITGADCANITSSAERRPEIRIPKPR